MTAAIAGYRILLASAFIAPLLDEESSMQGNQNGISRLPVADTGAIRQEDITTVYSRLENAL